MDKHPNSENPNMQVIPDGQVGVVKENTDVVIGGKDATLFYSEHAAPRTEVLGAGGCNFGVVGEDFQQKFKEFQSMSLADKKKVMMEMAKSYPTDSDKQST